MSEAVSFEVEPFIDGWGRPTTVCVRLDGLADKIAEALAENDYNWAGGYKQNAVAVVALLQSLAVQ